MSGFVFLIFFKKKKGKGIYINKWKENIWKKKRLFGFCWYKRVWCVSESVSSGSNKNWKEYLSIYINVLPFKHGILVFIIVIFFVMGN
jgi:predicted RNA-binding protein YlxR (DUF448 family)